MLKVCARFKNLTNLFENEQTILARIDNTNYGLDFDFLDNFPLQIPQENEKKLGNSGKQVEH